MTRVPIVCAVLLFVVFGTLRSAPVPVDDKETWVGRRVMPKKPDVLLSRVDEKGHIVKLGNLNEAVLTVLAEDGQWFKMRAHGVEGWFAKDDVVLLDKAVAFYTEQLTADAKDDFSLAMRGFAQMEKRDFEAALKDFDAVIAMKSKWAMWCHNLRGITFTRQGANDKALDAFADAIRYNPKYAAPYSNRANIYVQKKEFDKALADYTKVIELQPDSAVAYIHRALVYRDEADHDKVLADLADAIRLDPKYPHIYQTRGNIHFMHKDYAKAIPDFTEAIAIDPQAVQSYSQRAECYLKTNAPDKAIADLGEVIRLSPKNVLALQKRAGLYADKKEYDKAIADLGDAYPHPAGAHFPGIQARRVACPNEGV